MNKSHSRNLIISGSIFTLLILLWPIFMALSAGYAGSLEEKVLEISKDGAVYYIGFVNASLIAPSAFALISIVSGLYRKEKKDLFDSIGIVLLIGYCILNSISYISQYSILPRLITAGKINEAIEWLFDNKDSLVYFLNQMGYSLFGMGAIIIFKGSLRAKGIERLLGLIFCISGVLSILAFIGLLIQNELLNMLTIFSGLLLVPAGVLAIILGARITKQKVQSKNIKQKMLSKKF